MERGRRIFQNPRPVTIQSKSRAALARESLGAELSTWEPEGWQLCRVGLRGQGCGAVGRLWCPAFGKITACLWGTDHGGAEEALSGSLRLARLGGGGGDSFRSKAPKIAHFRLCRAQGKDGKLQIWGGAMCGGRGVRKRPVFPSFCLQRLCEGTGADPSCLPTSWHLRSPGKDLISSEQLRRLCRGQDSLSREVGCRAR